MPPKLASHPSNYIPGVEGGEKDSKLLVFSYFEDISYVLDSVPVVGNHHPFLFRGIL